MGWGLRLGKIGLAVYMLFSFNSNAVSYKNCMETIGVYYVE